MIITTDAEKYWFAQANKMIRLGLVERDEQTGEIHPTAAMADMDAGPITPDQIDIDEVERTTRWRQS